MAMYRKTTPATYYATSASNFTDSSKNWRKHSNFYRKTSGNETASLTAVPGRYTDSTRSWRRIKAMYIFRNGNWYRIHYKNANQPFATVAPTIRYNSYNGEIVGGFGTDAAAFWASDPYQPVWVQMGPGPQGIGQNTWYLDSNGNQVGSSNPTFLWGKDGDWVNSTNATTNATFVWSTNLDPYGGDQAYDDEGNYEGDKLRNSEAVMGTYDNYYIWYRISKTVGQYTGRGFSQAVYVSKQEPKVTSFTMVDTGVAVVGTAKTVTYNLKNEWWRSADRYSSKIEWHEVDYSGQTLDSNTLKQTTPLYNTTITTDNSTSLQGSATYTPVGSNKYIVAKLIVKNTYTEWPPVSDVSRTQTTTVATTAANGPFSLSNAQKFPRYYDTGSSSYKRTVSVEIGQSANADRYELQVRGYAPNVSGTYTFSMYMTYVTLLTYDASPYFYESNRSGGVLTATVNVDDYEYYEITARSKNGSTTTGSVISTNTLYPPSVAPSTPYIYNGTSNSDYFGTYIAFDLSQSSTGSNIDKYYEYSIDNGSWTQISTGTYGTFGTGYINTANGGKIYVNANTTYSVKIRLTNYDEMTSSESNSLSIQSVSPPSAPTSVVIKSFSNYSGHIFFTSGSNTGSVEGSLEYDSINATDYLPGYVNIGSNTAGVIALSGGNSISRSYTAYLRAWGNSNKTGPGGTLTNYGTKVLNGSDYPSVTQNTPTLGTDPRTINFSWSGSGATNKYSLVLYRWTGSSWVQLAASTTTSTSIQYTSANGVDYNTQYYLEITAIYEYANGVSYTGLTQLGSTITTGVNLSSPTITSVSYNTSNQTWTINYTGGSGPYYQVWYQPITSTSIPTLTGTVSSTPDATSSSSSSASRVMTAASGYAYYWWVRSAKTLNGTGAGNVSDWNGPVTMSPLVTVNPTLSGTTKVGQTLTYGAGTWINATSYDLRLYRGTQNVATYETLAASTSSTSGTYSIPSSDFTDPNGRRYYRSFVNASNGSYSSGFVGGTELGPLTNLTLYTVSFNANGGSSTPADVTQTSEGGSVTLPGAISQSGFTFGGWNTNQFGTGTTYAANSSYTPTSSLTLWAKWTSNAVIPTITMGSNSGVTSNQGTINWSSTNQSSWSSTGTFSGSGTTQTSVSKTGLTASTTYTGTVTVTSSTGNTASANYSLTTSAAATPGAITVSSISASKTATRQLTGTWSSSRTGTDTTFYWWNTRVRNTSSGATATHTLFSETPRSDSYTSLTGTSYRFGIQGVIYDNSFSTYRYSIGTSDAGSYAENSTNINPQ
jgi:hypothetical protein